MPAHASTPVVALTARAMPGDREELIKAGFDDYLSKPFTGTRLKEVIAKVLETHKDGA
jgi:two-component system sensor histidine kinase BarA